MGLLLGKVCFSRYRPTYYRFLVIAWIGCLRKVLPVQQQSHWQTEEYRWCIAVCSEYLFGSNPSQTGHWVLASTLHFDEINSHSNWVQVLVLQYNTMYVPRSNHSHEHRRMAFHLCVCVYQYVYGWMDGTQKAIIVCCFQGFCFGVLVIRKKNWVPRERD